MPPADRKLYDQLVKQLQTWAQQHEHCTWKVYTALPPDSYLFQIVSSGPPTYNAFVMIPKEGATFDHAFETLERLVHGLERMERDPD